MPTEPLSRENRANIVTARESLRRASDGYDDVDFDRAIGMLDAVLAATCPHDPASYVRAEVPDSSGGTATEVTCLACQVAWVEPHADIR